MEWRILYIHFGSIFSFYPLVKLSTYPVETIPRYMRISIVNTSRAEISQISYSPLDSCDYLASGPNMLLCELAKHNLLPFFFF